MVSKEELINLATLAKLDISDQDVDKLLADMEKIIEFANQINSASVSEVEFDSINNLQNVYREDIVSRSYSQDDILKNAKTVEDGFFRLDNRGQV